MTLEKDAGLVRHGMGSVPGLRDMTMRPIPLIRARYLQAFVRALDDLGVPASHFRRAHFAETLDTPMAPA